MPKLIPEWLWPCLAALPPEQHKWILSEREKVDQGSWGDSSDVALEEARRLFDAEQERRKGADSKAGLYLAAITALMPILATILPGLFDGKISGALRFTLLGVFICALIYLMRAGLWALQTIKVSAMAQLSAGEVAESFSSDKPKESLVKQLLNSVIYNYTGTNKKISCIKMTHEFLIRAFFCFAAFLTIQVAWPTAALVIDRIYSAVINPLMSCIS